MQSTMTAKPLHTFINWRLLALLAAAILISVILITPYALSLQAAALKTTPPALPLIILLPLQWLETVVLYSVFAAAGLFIAARIGLGLPFLESWLAGKAEVQILQNFVLKAICAGLFVGAALVILDKVVFSPLIDAQNARLGVTVPATPALHIPVWQGFLASFYGGVTEEILMRLFVLSLFAWVFRSKKRNSNGHPGSVSLWTANILAAVLFGLGHLPATAASGVPLTAPVLARAVILNGMAGIMFGWFYWTFGLEAAMVSHFSADIVVHVITPFIMGL